MKTRVITLVLTLALCFVLLPASVLAGDYDLNVSSPPKISDIMICQDGSAAWLEVQIKTPADVWDTLSLLEFAGKEYYYEGIGISYSLEGGAWQEEEMSFNGTGNKWSGVWCTGRINSLSSDSWVQARVRYYGVDDDGKAVGSDWSITKELNKPENPPEQQPEEPEEEPAEQPVDFIAHDWAKPELIQAMVLGLIPDSLQGADLTQPITRAEFAAVSVKVYEALSGLTAKVVWINPFVDTRDDEVLKAVNLGVTNGVSATEFAPDKLLNREQAATMLARVYKKAFIPGWTLDDDAWFVEKFSALFTMPEPFADDGDISSWARDSVYFMAANGIIKGMEGGTFQPRAVTAEQQAAGYAQATREQALLIAVRMVKNLQE